MIERIVILIVLSGITVAAYRWFQRWQIRRVAAFALGDPLLAAMRPVIPAILYFTTPTCAPCQTRQRPALRDLLAEMGDGVQVIEVNALEKPEAADRWGVLSVPTTFVLDGQGHPRQINYGVTGAAKLKSQLQRL